MISFPCRPWRRRRADADNKDEHRLLPGIGVTVENEPPVRSGPDAEWLTAARSRLSPAQLSRRGEISRELSEGSVGAGPDAGDGFFP